MRLGRKSCPIHGRAHKYQGVCWGCVNLECDARDRLERGFFAPLITNASPLAFSIFRDFYSAVHNPKTSYWAVDLARDLKYVSDKSKFGGGRIPTVRTVRMLKDLPAAIENTVVFAFMENVANDSFLYPKGSSCLVYNTQGKLFAWLKIN